MGNPLVTAQIKHGGTIMDEATMTEDKTSDIVHLLSHNAAVQVVTNTGTHVGVVKIQVSVDGSTWVDYAFLDSSGNLLTELTVASGTANGDIVEVESAAKFLRVFYDYTSGDGTITVKVVRDSSD